MEIALVFGLIILGLGAFLYFLRKFIYWAMDIHIPDGEMHDSSDSEFGDR